MIKIVTVLGARPQFIKAAVVSSAFKSSKSVNEVIIHTGQHYDFKMDKIFFEELNIPCPTYSLNINNMPHGAMLGKMIENIEYVLLKENPDYLLVYGDTNSTLAGALAAVKCQIKIIHIEAGLRSYNMQMPEEVNRILTDRISNLLFCPTENAVKMLQNEGFDNYNCRVINSGDVMYDLVKLFEQKKHTSDNAEKYILATIHRENNMNADKLSQIIKALNILSERMKIIFPFHPRTRKVVLKQKLDLNFDMLDPVSYFEMMSLIKNSSFVITDSGGLQKEAFFFKKNVVVLRDESEWVELIENNFAVVAGTETNNIIAKADAIDKLNKDFNNYQFYGDGNAAKIIVDSILN